MRPQLLIIVLLTFAVRSYSQCEPPPYRRATRLKSSEGIFKISVRPQDFSVNKILCLTEDLKRRHPEWEEITLLIFDSHDVAKEYAGYSIEDVPSNRWAKDLHIMYSLGKTKNEEHLDILPFGWNTGRPDATVIVIPLKEKPRCRYEFGGHCVLGLAGHDYLYSVRKAASGTVKLSATINADGTVSAVKVDESDISPVEQRKHCETAAVEDLSRWRLEAGVGIEPLHITYAFRVDHSLKRGDVDVRYELPGQVLIRGNP